VANSEEYFNTIQQVLHENFQSCAGRDTVIAAGRTDSGVHARQNFVHFDTSKKFRGNFMRRINFSCRIDSAVRAIFTVKEIQCTDLKHSADQYEYLISYEKSDPKLTWFLLPYDELSVKKWNEHEDHQVTDRF